MYYLDFLARLHQRLEPSSYLEIGIRHGDSLALAACPSVGVDPEFELRVELGDNVTLFPETSDEYFAREEPLAPFGGRPVDLAFIDGMHLFEFALRDFMGVERLARWTSVAVFDDILPPDPRVAARDRRTRAWTGDVYKLLDIFRRIRPDLVCLQVGTQPTGLLLVLALDPESTRLAVCYDDILTRSLVPDPQSVPADVLARRGALDPEAVLASRLWPALRAGRASSEPPHRGARRLRRMARRELGVRSGGLRLVLPAPA